MRRLLVLALLVVPALARAQSSGGQVPQTDTVFLRAQRLVAEGQGDAGRALVQAQLAAAPAGSAQYAEALYWHAVVAATAADAERDLRTLIIEYPLSPRSADALMRLAQLEMTRGDNDQAIAHLQRVVTEHPDSPMRARAEFWMGRALFEQGKAPAACARLADASRATPSTEVELRNQIDYLNQRCAGVDTTAAAPSAAAASATPHESTTTRRESTSARSRTAPHAAPARGSGRYTIQVAAYSTRDSAERLRKSLAARGYDARVVGSAKPFRVRVGRYATREEANAAAAHMRASKISVYVTEAEPR